MCCSGTMASKPPRQLPHTPSPFHYNHEHSQREIGDLHPSWTTFTFEALGGGKELNPNSNLKRNQKEAMKAQPRQQMLGPLALTLRIVSQRESVSEHRKMMNGAKRRSESGESTETSQTGRFGAAELRSQREFELKPTTKEALLAQHRVRSASSDGEENKDFVLKVGIIVFTSVVLQKSFPVDLLLGNKAELERSALRTWPTRSASWRHCAARCRATRATSETCTTCSSTAPCWPITCDRVAPAAEEHVLRQPGAGAADAAEPVAQAAEAQFSAGALEPAKRAESSGNLPPSSSAARWRRRLRSTTTRFSTLRARQDPTRSSGTSAG